MVSPAPRNEERAEEQLSRMLCTAEPRAEPQGVPGASGEGVPQLPPHPDSGVLQLQPIPPRWAAPRLQTVRPCIPREPQARSRAGQCAPASDAVIARWPSPLPRQCVMQGYRRPQLSAQVV
jgi:hypothetical protein